MTTTIDVHEAQHQLAALLDLARFGTEVIIAEGGIPIARLTGVNPVSTQTQPRVAGLHQGSAWISEDFDQPLPDEFWVGAT